MTTPVPAPIPATLRHDPISHFHWLELQQRCDEETRDQLKRNGWRWSRYREQWYTNRRYHTIPASIAVTDGGKCDYSSERADRLNARADCHYERYQERHEKAHARASRIPFGQPVLIGHHSQRRHERDIERIHKDFGKAFEELDISKDLRSKARRSANLQAYKQTAPAMSKRLERLNVEKRQLQRRLDEIDAEHGGIEYRAHYQQQLDAVRAEISELEQAIEDAGGLLADHVQVNVGDIVNLRGYDVRVTRVNPKTFSGVIVAPDNRGLDGWKGKWDRADFRGIVRRKDEKGEEPGK